MAYRIDQQTNELVIDGWENGIAASPYQGISNIRNLNTSYYPGVAYVNYRRQAATIQDNTGDLWFAGTHSVNVSNNSGWFFNSPSGVTMTNPVQKATSPTGLNYILDDSGNVWKQSAVNSSTFNLLGDGGRFTNGAGGLAYWQNYLVVFGNGVIEFCGDGSGDAGITGSNWNKNQSLTLQQQFSTNFAVQPLQIAFTFQSILPQFTVGTPVMFTNTGGGLPAPLVAGTTYYIVLVASDNSYVEVSATLGGTAITLTNDGSGNQFINEIFNVSLPIGNLNTVSISFYPTGTTGTIASYTNPNGTAGTITWDLASGLYNIVDSNGFNLPANFVNNSNSVTFLSPPLFIGTSTSVWLLNPTVSFYRPYVSKVDGSLYFCNGQFLGRIAISTSSNIVFNPSNPSSYSVSFGVASIPEEFTDTIVDMVDLKSQLVVAGQQDIYTWDYNSATTSSPSPVSEKISSIANVLSNIYILAGTKGNIYVSNGYSAQLFYKMPDYIAGAIDPVWLWGGLMSHRSRLYFQALIQTNAGVNILAGIFALIVSPSLTGEVASGLIMDSQNSYGLTPAAGALQNGVLISNTSTGLNYTNYYSAWSNGTTTGGIDYNDSTEWQNYEPLIETDIIPIGSILNKQTLGETQFKLDRQMVAGDSIKLYARASLSDSYTLIGTSSTAQLSENFPSNLAQSQWIQFQITFKCASSGSSRIPLRELRFQLI